MLLLAAVLGSPHQLDELSHLARGCVRVLLDLGANLGVHSRFLFEPRKYPESKMVPAFDRVFGLDRNDCENMQSTCAFAFEPNPVHAKRLTQLEAAYRRIGHRFYYLAYGVGASSGELIFHKNPTKSSLANEHWSFGVKDRFNGSRQEQLHVPSAGFHEVLELIERRDLSSEAGSSRSPKVFVKMDIEGMEFEVIPNVMMRGSLCRAVDLITVEFHAKLAPLRLHKKQSLDLLHSGVPPPRSTSSLPPSTTDGATAAAKWRCRILTTSHMDMTGCGCPTYQHVTNHCYYFEPCEEEESAR